MIIDMTCIVGIVDKKNKNVVLGGDSAGSAGSYLTIRKDSKVFKTGDFIFGCTSSFRMIQLLRFSFKPPRVYDKDIYEYMCTDFINEIRECFKNGGYLQKYSDGDDKGGTFLVGYKDRLFKIENDFQVGESLDGVDACGCGMDSALGVLHYVKDGELSADEKALAALEISRYTSTGVEPPFNLVRT